MNLLRYGMMTVVSLTILTLTPVRGDDANTAHRSRASDIDQKLKSIIVSIDFNEAKIDDAIQALAALSKQDDPDHQGINFVVQPEVSVSTKKVTLKLDKVPVGAALHYLCELGGISCTVDERLISITPEWVGDGLVKRTFHVDPNFVEAVSSAGVIPSATGP